MEFDKTKVYTTFNYDEVKISSKGYFADSKEDLISRVKFESKAYYGTLDKINSHTSDYVYTTNSCAYRYFYLVEEPKEKTKRPCTREELIGMLIAQGVPMLKHLSNVVRTVISIHQENVFDEVGAMSYLELCEQYTLLNGNDLWVEE